MILRPRGVTRLPYQFLFQSFSDSDICTPLLLQHDASLFQTFPTLICQEKAEERKEGKERRGGEGRKGGKKEREKERKMESDHMSKIQLIN